jgi:predicted SAM-dependent methyltransferase
MLHQLSSGIRNLRARRHTAKLRDRLRVEVEQLSARRAPLKLVVGAGSPVPRMGEAGTPYEGWLLTDVDALNALRREEWAALFQPGSIQNILAEHVMEHLTEEQFLEFLGVIRDFLAPDARVRIAVPDGFHPDSSYIEQVRPGGTGPGADDHKVLYTYSRMASLLTRAGWDYDFLEYFDEHGEFHLKPWEQRDGLIRRSAFNDPRNKERPQSYTSLIVDIRPK